MKNENFSYCKLFRSMETAVPDDRKEELANIAPSGDVILVVGAESLRLRVYSQCLRSASKIFDAMLGPNWSEGQRRSEATPTEVALPGDDAHAMRTICCFIHHRNDLEPDLLTAEEILQIAIEVDKYDLRVALKYASSEWLKPSSFGICRKRAAF